MALGGNVSPARRAFPRGAPRSPWPWGFSRTPLVVRTGFPATGVIRAPRAAVDVGDTGRPVAALGRRCRSASPGPPGAPGVAHAARRHFRGIGGLTEEK